MPLSDIGHHFSCRRQQVPRKHRGMREPARAMVQQEGAPGNSRGQMAGPPPCPRLGPQWHRCLAGSAQGQDRPDPQGSPRARSLWSTGNLFQPWMFPSDAENVNKKHTPRARGI